MDKFGIFKLLNSFFSFCEQNKTPNTDKNPQENNGLNDLLSAFTQKPKPEQTESLKEKQPQKTFAPL
ncbi:MAG: hypothetical protein IJW47_01845 [Clostridia bacterium]|nr:hypothetical protein [Clostridia bacterium]